MPTQFGNSNDGTTSGSNGHRVYVAYSYTQNVAGNYTDVSWEYGVDYGDPNYWNNIRNRSVAWTVATGASVSGVSGSGTGTSDASVINTSNPGYGGQMHAFYTGIVRITHNSAGQGTIRLNASMMFNGTWTSSITNFDIALPTIPREPGAPGTPSVSGHADSDPTTATITWTAPSNVGAGLSQRQIQISTSGTFTSTLIDSTATWGTSFDATGLAKGTLFYVRVRASSSAGFGPWSTTQSFTTGTTVPGAPGTPTTGTVTYTSIAVSWAAPSDSGGQTISGYTVERATNSGFTTGNASYSASGTSYTITGLTATTNYWVRVKAVNATGTGAASTSLATGTQAATAPDPTAAPTFTDVLGTSVQVNWVAPATHGASITSYSLQRAPNSSGSPGTWTTIQSGISSAATGTQVTGLDYGETYWFRIIAISSAGNSTGASASVTTGSTTPFSPAAPSVSAITQTTAVVSYTAPDDGGSAITGYDIQRATDNLFTHNVVTTPDAGSPLDITGVAPAIQHWVRVRAKNINGNGLWSPATPFTPLASAYVFSGSTPIGCQVYIWNGSAWVLCTTQKWSGSAWV